MDTYTFPVLISRDIASVFSVSQVALKLQHIRFEGQVGEGCGGWGQGGRAGEYGHGETVDWVDA